MKSLRIAIVGATGLVGTNVLKILEERNFPISTLLPVASEKSIGKFINYGGVNDADFWVENPQVKTTIEVEEEYGGFKFKNYLYDKILEALP